MRTLVFFLFVSVIALAAHSDEKRQDQKKPTKQQETGSENRPLVVKIAPAPKTQEEANREAEERDAKRRSEERKQKTDDELADYTGQLAAYTKQLFWVGALQAAVLAMQIFFVWRQETATKTIERAYVKMSHRMPGVKLNFDEGSAYVAVDIKNFGRTPAHVTNTILKHAILSKDEELPKTLDYGDAIGEQSDVRAFLVSQDFVTHARTFNLGTAATAAVVKGDLKLWVFGYADYIDKFGTRRRGGYARQMLWTDTTNNLYYPLKGSHNFDRRRIKGEGCDWGEKAPT